MRRLVLTNTRAANSARRLLPASPPQQPMTTTPRLRLRHRPLSTAAAMPPPPSSSATAHGGPAPPKAQPGILSRNVGKIVMATLTSLVAWLYRSSENKKRSKTLKVFLEDHRAIEPWEIDEFRMANWDTLDRARFRDVAAAVQAAFPDGQASYTALIKVVAGVLGPQRPLQLAHYLDRVVLFTQPDAQGPVDTLTFLCALSLSLNLDPEERVGALYDALVTITTGGATEQHDGGDGRHVDLVSFRKLLGGLVATAQLPAEVLVKPDKSKEYPFQSYEVATIEQLVHKAVVETKEKHEKAVKAALKAGTPPPAPLSVEEGGEETARLSTEEVVQLLSTKAVCVWGECYQGRE